MLTTRIKKKLCHRNQKMKGFGFHEDYLRRITKSLYYVQLPISNYTSLPVTELAAEIFSQANKFSLDRLDIQKAAHYTRNGCISPSLLVLALVYLERLKTLNPQYLSKISPTELFLISILVGSKFLQDDGEEGELSNTVWANSAGCTVEDINKAEREFLDAINWKIYVSEDEFWKRLNSLESKVCLKQGSKRGWFTYTELNVLLQLIDLSNLVQCLWNVTSACMLSYTASILALIGSTLIVGQIPYLNSKTKISVSTETENWKNLSCSFISENLLTLNNENQDCNYLPPMESAMKTNSAAPELLKLSTGPELNWHFNNQRNGNYDKQYVINWHPSPSTSLGISSSTPLDLIDIDYWINKDRSKIETDSNWSHRRNFNLWKWTDFIKNSVIKESVPGGLHLISSF